MRDDKLVSDFSPIQSFFSHKKGLIDILIPKANNNILITTSNDCTVKIWDVSTGVCKKEFLFEKKVTAIAVVIIHNI